MKDYYKILKDQGLTDAEIAESYILPSEPMTEEEHSEFLKLRMERLKNTSPEDIALIKQMREKFKKEKQEKIHKKLRTHIQEVSSTMSVKQKKHIENLGEKFKKEDE